jgi:hypothetical protein
MNKLTVIIIGCLIAISAFSQTAIYHPFPKNNAQWNESLTANGIPCEHFQYNLSGLDTLIQSVSYKQIIKTKVTYQLYTSGPNTGMCNWCCASSPVVTYAGCIRNDSLAKKVYYVIPNANKDTLLYDFSLNVGDTLKTFITTQCSPVKINYIDSVLIGSSYRKQWHVVNCLFGYTTKIIEGIGSDFGLLEQMSHLQKVSSLNCYSEQAITLYPNNNSANCPSLTTGIENIIHDIIKIFPNPTKNNITISQAESTFKKYEIYDINGRLVSENKINGIIQKVDLTGYAEGMYIVKLIGNQKVDFKKIVVVE